MANLMYFIVFFATTLLDQTLGFSVALNKNFAVWGESLDIILNIGTINTVVTLYRPDGTTAGTCLAPSSGVSGGCSPGLTQDIAGGTTTYSIASVSRATDQGEWASSHGSDTGSKNITVHTIPTVTESNSLSSLTLSSDSSTSNTQSLTITVTCAYPAVSLNLFYVPTGGGNEVNAPSSTSTCTSTGNTGCSDTNATSYTCDITPQYEATLSAGTTYYIKAAVKLDGLSIGVDITINGTDITVQATTTTPATADDDCDCTIHIILMCIGIVLTVGTVVWIWLVYGVNIDKIDWKFLKPKDKKAKHVKKEISVSVLFVADIVITVVVVIGVILGIVGFIVCKGCNSTNDKEHTGLILAIIGFIVVVVIALLAVIVLTILIVCVIIRIKKSEKSNVRDRPEGQETNKASSNLTFERMTTARSTGSPTSASKIRTRLANNKVSDSNESDGEKSTPRGGHLELVPRDRKLPPLERTSEQENTEVKRLKKKKQKKNKKQKDENEQQENDDE